MREIKFRIWDKSDNRYLPIHSDAYKLCFHGDFWSVSPLSKLHKYWPFSSISNPNFVVQQYTGSKDKNNKEIFEGDFVNFYTPKIDHGPDMEVFENQQVTYSPEDACFFFGEHKFHPYEIKGIEVITKTK